MHLISIDQKKISIFAIRTKQRPYQKLQKSLLCQPRVKSFLKNFNAIKKYETTITLKELKKQFDISNSIVLIEDKRNVLEAEKEKLTAL